MFSLANLTPRNIMAAGLPVVNSNLIIGNNGVEGFRNPLAESNPRLLPPIVTLPGIVISPPSLPETPKAPKTDAPKNSNNNLMIMLMMVLMTLLMNKKEGASKSPLAC